MSNKTEKKNTTKKASKNRKTLMLKLNAGVEIPARAAYMKDNTKCFKINDIDINKIRISEKKLYRKEHNSYKHYVFYERDDNDYITLRIILQDVVGYYSVYKDSNKMNFRLNSELYDKINGIFDHIQEKLNVDLSNFTFLKRGEEYFNATVSDETCFREGKNIFTPKENIMYTCRVLLQIQSVFYNTKDNKDDIKYYLQILLEQCISKRFFNNNTIVHPDLEFTDTEPDSDSESEEEINENTAFDE